MSHQLFSPHRLHALGPKESRRNAGGTTGGILALVGKRKEKKKNMRRAKEEEAKSQAGRNPHEFNGAQTDYRPTCYCGRHPADQDNRDGNIWCLMRVISMLKDLEALFTLQLQLGNPQRLGYCALCHAITFIHMLTKMTVFAMFCLLLDSFDAASNISVSLGSTVLKSFHKNSV